MQNKKGYIGLIALMISLAVMLYWFFYLWNKNWFGNSLQVPQVSTDQKQTNSAVPATTDPSNVNKQLNNLRQDLNDLQKKKDQEILNELKNK